MMSIRRMGSAAAATAAGFASMKMLQGRSLATAVRTDAAADHNRGQPLGVYDVVVVGGGAVGLATAREVLGRYPAKTVCVLEKETGVAAHQVTSHITYLCWANPPI
jgi:hypothetical protein